MCTLQWAPWCIIYTLYAYTRVEWKVASYSTKILKYRISSALNSGKKNTEIYLKVNTNRLIWPCHSSGGQSPASHCGGKGSRPEQSMWDLWWKKWQYDRVFSKSFCFTLSVSFHRCSVFTNVLYGGWIMGPLAAAVPQRQSHAIATIKNVIFIKITKHLFWK
jgi:hypothetical protein